MMNVRQEVQKIMDADEEILQVLVAEYLLLKGDMEQAYRMFADLHGKNTLPDAVRKNVRTYFLYVASEMRKKELDKTDFSIVVCYPGRESIDITRDNFIDKMDDVGMLLELLDFNVKKYVSRKEHG